MAITPAVVGASADLGGRQPNLSQGATWLGAARDGPGFAQSGDDRIAQAGPLGESQQPPQRFAGHQDKVSEPARDEFAQPFQDGRRVGSVQDADQRIAQRHGPFFLQHLGQFFELPALGQGHAAAFERSRQGFAPVSDGRRVGPTYRETRHAARVSGGSHDVRSTHPPGHVAEPF